MTTNSKCTLKQFAIDNGIPYRTIRERAVGWTKERQARHQQKTSKIIDETISKQIDSEVEMNLRHYDIARKLLDVVEKSVSLNELMVSPKSINSLAKSIETIQKVQRIASGLEKSDTAKGDLVKDFMEAVINGTNEQTGK